MAMGKGIGGMVAAGGKMGANRDAVAARKAASVAGGPKATRPTTGKSGFGVLGNSKAGSSAAGMAAAAGKNPKMGKRPASKKPFGTL